MARSFCGYDPTGRELWTWEWPLTGLDRFHGAMHEPATQHAKATETTNAVQVDVGSLSVTFDKQTGLLSGIRRGEQIFSFTNGPCFTSGTNLPSKINCIEDGPDVVVPEHFDDPSKTVSWRVNGNGWLDCDYSYAASGTNDFLGITFDYPESLVRHKRWLGNGPYRVWKNRLPGVSLGAWDNDYNNTLTGFRDWIYPEFKGFFSDVRWLELDTAEGQVTVVNNSGGAVHAGADLPEFPPMKLVGKGFCAGAAVWTGFHGSDSAYWQQIQGPGSDGTEIAAKRSRRRVFRDR